MCVYVCMCGRVPVSKSGSFERTLVVNTYSIIMFLLASKTDAQTDIIIS